MLKVIYKYITKEKNIALFRKCDRLLQAVGGKLYVKTLGQLKYRLRFGTGNHEMSEEEKKIGERSFCTSFEKPITDYSELTVSVLIQTIDDKDRLREQIQKQTYKKVEIIESLDDIEKVDGELLWIPSDKMEYEPNFLEEMLPLFAYQSVLLAFCAHGQLREEVAPFSTQYVTAHDILQEVLRSENPFGPIGGALLRVGDDLKIIIGKTGLSLADSNYLAPMICAERGGIVAYTDKTFVKYPERYMPDRVDTFLDELREKIDKQESIVMACYALRSEEEKPSRFIWPTH